MNTLYNDCKDNEYYADIVNQIKGYNFKHSTEMELRPSTTSEMQPAIYPTTQFRSTPSEKTPNAPYSIEDGYSRPSNLSYYVAIDLIMVPGTKIEFTQKAKLKCQTMFDNVRKSLSQSFGTIYVPTPPVFITTGEEYEKSAMSANKENPENRIIQQDSLTELIDKMELTELKRSEFNRKLEFLLQDNTQDMTKLQNAFIYLRVGSEEYNSILVNHEITEDELRSLIDRAKYFKNLNKTDKNKPFWSNIFRGGRNSRKMGRPVTNARKGTTTKKQRVQKF